MAININPANRGKFTARAKSKGHSIGQQIQSDIGGAHGEKQRKRAQFAKNARAWARKRKNKRSTKRRGTR
jgi:hypothetical protein